MRDRLPELLDRPGLPRPLRCMVVTGAAIWRADWSTLRAAAIDARANHQSRQDLEETLLQSILFCGFPRVVTAFGELNAAWPASPAPSGGSLPHDEALAAGQQLFAAIYGQHDGAVRAMLLAGHRELHDFVFEAAYGRILCRPHLDARTRELLAVAQLAAQDQVRQFVAHGRGARSFGADEAELLEVLLTVFGSDEPGTERARTWLAKLR